MMDRLRICMRDVINKIWFAAIVHDFKSNEEDASRNLNSFYSYEKTLQKKKSRISE